MPKAARPELAAWAKRVRNSLRRAGRSEPDVAQTFPLRSHGENPRLRSADERNRAVVVLVCVGLRIFRRVRSRVAPPPRSSFRLIRCLPEAQFPSVLGPAEGEGSGRSSVARRSLRGRVLRFPPLSAGRFPQGFSSSRPTVRHMTYRNRAIVPPRCGLQRAGSVPPRSAERRAVRRPVPVVQPPTAPRPFMGSAPLAERIPPHRAAGCSDEETFGDHRLFPAASPLFCRFALTKGRPLLTNGFGALIFAGSPFPVRRPLPEIKSTWGGRRRQHHGRFGRLN